MIAFSHLRLYISDACMACSLQSPVSYKMFQKDGQLWTLPRASSIPLLRHSTEQQWVCLSCRHSWHASMSNESCICLGSPRIVMRLAKGHLPLTHSYGVTRAGSKWHAMVLYSYASPREVPTGHSISARAGDRRSCVPRCSLINASHVTSLFGMSWYIIDL